jgi:hypothetical protein
VAANEKITGVSCAVYFDVQLNSIAKYLFDAVIFANYESGTPIAKLDMEGDMKIRLSWPLSAYGGYKTPYQNDPLFPAFKFGTSAEEFYLDVITRKSNNRNSTCISRSAHASIYSPRTTVWFVVHSLDGVPTDVAVCLPACESGHVHRQFREFVADHSHPTTADFVSCVSRYSLLMLLVGGG